MSVCLCCVSRVAMMGAKACEGRGEMVIIKTTCPSCGEVDLTAERVELRIALGGTGSSYAFDCPSCTDRIRKPADARVVQLLISGGVAPEGLTEPAHAPVDPTHRNS